MNAREPKDAPGVAFHPPILVIALAATAWTLWREAPLPFLPEAAVRSLGAALGAISFLRFSSAVLALHRVGTHISTHLPSRALVTSGPYRFSRNPIDLGIDVGLVSAGVIVREERYLREKFGAAYLKYSSEVRRWL